VASHGSGQLARDLLVRDMVGRSVDRLFPEMPPPAQDAEVALSVRNLTARDGRFKNLSFEVRRGEVLGFAGISGAGRTEAMRAIAGVDPFESGEIWIGGKAIRAKSPKDVIREGLVLVPDDRKALGVVLQHSIAENIAYSNTDQVAPDGWVWPKKRDTFAQSLITKLTVKGSPDQTAGSLSGGNQQKVVIAKWIAHNPKVIILDEPTRGVDVGARAQIYEVIAGLARQGMAVIVVSSDLDEVLGLSHRVVVLARGEIRGEFAHGLANSQNVMDLAVH
jgi:ribose transport system ATP-binding protein